MTVSESTSFLLRVVTPSPGIVNQVPQESQVYSILPDNGTSCTSSSGFADASGATSSAENVLNGSDNIAFSQQSDSARQAPGQPPGSGGGGMQNNGSAGASLNNASTRGDNMAEGGTVKGMSPDDINLKMFGHHRFRAAQKDIIMKALKPRDIMVIMPTGGGKSLCYQIPALCDRGLAVVVTPLLSLAQDQVSSLEKNGINAKYLSSSQDSEEIQVLSNTLLCGSLLVVVSTLRTSVNHLHACNSTLSSPPICHCCPLFPGNHVGVVEL